MILNDKQIIEYCSTSDLITPFSYQTKTNGQNPVISYGVSSYGYDVRLSSIEFLLLENSGVANPKNPATVKTRSLDLMSDSQGSFWVIPSHSCCLGVTLERIKMPSDCMAFCLGKSTYARYGLIVNATPIEAGWQGHITLEISNTSDSFCRVYAEEGIAQLVFFQGEVCQTTYQQKAGKYQCQTENVTLGKV